MQNRGHEITSLILKAKEKAKQDTGFESEPALTGPIKWPIECLVGPGLEGAIACETKIGYVNGSKGWLVYRGYDIFDLCAYSSFEEVAYLLLHGALPSKDELTGFQKTLNKYLYIPETFKLLMNAPVREMSSMAALRLGTSFLRSEFTDVDDYKYTDEEIRVINADEDSIPMETDPKGEKQAIYEFKQKKAYARSEKKDFERAVGRESCYHLIAGVASVAAAIARLRQGHLPLEPDPDLSYAANFIYMMTGHKPGPVEERIMDVSLILHADHGMNASTFAAMVVASTLSDIYFSIGSGIAALNGPLHGGANEKVLHMLKEIGSVGNVKTWYENALKTKQKIMGFGHRVYKAYDPRARVLGPLAEYLSEANETAQGLLAIARELEKEVLSTLGAKKGIFPNVDFYSGIVYSAMGIAQDMFTPIFAVSRVSGWTARVLEYLENNRIFRPRAIYVGPFDKEYIPINQR